MTVLTEIPRHVPVSNPLIMKLEHGARLTDEDRATLRTFSAPTYHVEAQQDLIHEGDRPENVHLVMSGFACRYKVLADGKRQILAFLIPGDFCDLHVAILGAMDHSICTLSPCTIVAISRETIADLTENHPRLTRALWWATLVDEGILREWLTGMGQRSSKPSGPPLLRVAGAVAGRRACNAKQLPPPPDADRSCRRPRDSAVHMNRTLQQLRAMA